jgi:hypothetical protein
MDILKEITPIWEQYASTVELLQQKPRFHTFEEKNVLFLGFNPSLNAKKNDTENCEYTLDDDKSKVSYGFQHYYDFAEAMGIDRSQWTYQDLFYYQGLAPKELVGSTDWETFLYSQLILSRNIMEQIQPLFIYVTNAQASEYLGIDITVGSSPFCGYEFEFNKEIGCFKIIGCKTWEEGGLSDATFKGTNLIGTYIYFSREKGYYSLYEKETKNWHLNLIWNKVKKVGKIEADGMKKNIKEAKEAEIKAIKDMQKATDCEKMKIMNEVKKKDKMDRVKRISKPIKLRNSVFTEKEMNTAELNTLLSIENMLFEVNERTKLEHISTFITEDLSFSLDKDSLTIEDFAQIIDFFNEAGFLEEYQLKNILEQMDQFEYFKDWFMPVKASNIEVVMKQLAFGSFEFENFDFRDKENERALEYHAHYGQLPTYEVADIEQKNQCIENICANLMTDLGIDADTEIQQLLLNDALSDPGKSIFKILFWIKGNTIFVVKNMQ